MKEKLKSRKLWLSLIPALAGIAELFGADRNTAELICGALLVLVPSVFYVITEGRIDAARKKELAESARTLIDKTTE